MNDAKPGSCKTPKNPPSDLAAEAAPQFDNYSIPLPPPAAAVLRFMANPTAREYTPDPLSSSPGIVLTGYQCHVRFILFIPVIDLLSPRTTSCVIVSVDFPFHAPLLLPVPPAPGPSARATALQHPSAFLESWNHPQPLVGFQRCIVFDEYSMRCLRHCLAQHPS